jgi:hypothetical protein
MQFRVTTFGCLGFVVDAENETQAQKKAHEVLAGVCDSGMRMNLSSFRIEIDPESDPEAMQGSSPMLPDSYVDAMSELSDAGRPL